MKTEVYVHMKVKALLNHGFSRQECWSGLPFPSPKGLPDPGVEPRSCMLQAESLLSETSEKPLYISTCIWIYVYIYAYTYYVCVDMYTYKCWRGKHPRL